MFGASPPPQNEGTPFAPRSPYAAAKVYAYWMAVNYREGSGMFAANGILFNHESPRRGETFVTRKVTRAVARIRAEQQRKVYLGNLDARRDWGYAPEYVEAMWRILQQDEPDDYAIGTGESHSVREFVEEAFAYAGLDWQGARRDRLPVLPAHGRERPAGRRAQGEASAGVGAPGRLPRARQDNGRRGHGGDRAAGDRRRGQVACWGNVESSHPHLSPLPSRERRQGGHPHLSPLPSRERRSGDHPHLSPLPSRERRSGDHPHLGPLPSRERRRGDSGQGNRSS